MDDQWRGHQQADQYGQISNPLYSQPFYQPQPPPPPGPQQQQAVNQFQGGEEQGYTMFEDTSGVPTPMPSSSEPNPFGGVAGNLLSNPAMSSAAMDYGAGVAKDMMEQNLGKVSGFLSLAHLKYYFAVDTTYVLKKLGIVAFPFSHRDWTCKYNKSEPVAPRYEINAPDLYIPLMAFVTYILLAGSVLGTQMRFSPEELGILASSLLAWLLVEVLLIWVCLYIFSIVSDLKWMDIMAYSGYKYVCMVLILGVSILTGPTGYYASLAWTSLTIVYFLIQSLRLSLQASADTGQRRNYFLIAIALLQPLLVVWLTWRLVMYTPQTIMGTKDGLPTSQS